MLEGEGDPYFDWHLTSFRLFQVRIKMLTDWFWLASSTLSDSLTNN